MIHCMRSNVSCLALNRRMVDPIFVSRRTIQRTRNVNNFLDPIFVSRRCLVCHSLYGLVVEPTLRADAVAVSASIIISYNSTLS